MSRKFAKNSKKGLTLPMAIVISIVLVIVAAGLVFIALSSISTTDVSVSGRQAFIDVRSALEYAESYYRTQVTNYAKIGTEKKDTVTGKKWREEYIIAEEKEIPITATQMHNSVEYTVQQDEPDTAKVKTYVTVRYFPGKGKTPPQLKLTGYSHYSDSFQHNGKSVSMSVMFTVGSSNTYKRVTVINTWKDPNTQSSSDTITLHLKKPADLKWTAVCYYIWTYNDIAKAYHDSDGKNIKYSYYDKDGNKITPAVDKVNINEKAKSIKPNSVWETSPSAAVKGPNGMMVTQGNGWSVGDYQINSKRVNYFNVIFANQSTLLDPDGIFDSQMNEIFHLWYLNENDKNIYFEFFNKQKYDSAADLYYYTRYRTGGNWSSKGKLSVDNNDDLWDSWNGVDGLDDTILVYLRNQKTTVHFRSWNDPNSMEKPSSDSAPVIESVTLSDGSEFNGPTFLSNSGRDVECGGEKAHSNIKMTYEGCGWWVANIETKKNFNITIKYAKDMASAVTLNNVRPHTDSSAPEAVPESWIVLKSDKKLEAHQTEKMALDAIGVETDSYVTIHAKNYDPDIPASPILNYMNVVTESSAGRQKLYEAILDMNMLQPSDYSNYEDLFGDKVDGTLGLKNKAIGAYNAGVEFMKAPYKVDETPITPTDGAEVNVSAADEAYMSYVNRIRMKIKELLPAYADADTINSFKETYEEAKIIYENLIDYDSGFHSGFKTKYEQKFTGTSYSDYEQLYALVQNRANVTITKTALSDADDILSAAVATIKEQKLNRTGLENLIKEIDSNSNYQDPKVYQALYIGKLNDQLETARPLIAKNPSGKYKNATTVAVLTKQGKDLNDAFEELKNMVVPKNPDIDFTELDENILQAASLIGQKEESGENYTDASKSVLSQIITEAGQLKEKEGVTAEEVSAEVQRLQKYMNRLTVYKPQAIVDKVKAEGKVRIWLQNKSGCTYSVSAKGTTGDFVRITDSRMNFESGTGLTYVDFVKSSELYFKISASISATDETLSTAEIEVNSLGDNVIFGLDEEDKNIVEKELVTVFLSRRDADQNNITINGFIATNNQTIGYGTEENYAFIRFAVEKGKSFTELLAITQSDTKNNTTTTAGLTADSAITAPGEYIVTWTDDGDIKKYKKISVSDVYPKTFAVPEPPAEPKPTGTVAPVEEEYEIVPVSSDLNWGAVFEDILKKDPMSDDEVCILFDTNDKSEFNDHSPYIYAWTGGGSSESERNASYENKPKMTRYGSTAYYYYQCKSIFGNFIISNASGNDDESKGLRKVMQDDIESGYKYYVYRAGTSGSIWKSNTAGASTVGGKDIYSVIDVPVEAGKLCIFFDTQNSGKQPYIHYWGGNDHTEWGTLTAMTKFSLGNNYYYVIISDENSGFLIANDSKGDHKVVSADGKLDEKGSGGRYSYYIVRAKADGRNYDVTPYETTPSVDIGDTDDDVKDLKSGFAMAYVGGGRIRVKNKSYVDTYGPGKKWNSMVSGDKYNTETEGKDDSYLTGVLRCIIVYKDGDGTDYGTGVPRIYLWKQGGHSDGSWGSRPKMTWFQSIGSRHYYYILADSYFNRFKLTNEGDKEVTGDCSLGDDEVYIIKGTDGNVDASGSKTSISLPSGLTLPNMDSGTSSAVSQVESTLHSKDKTTLSNSWKFGGYGSNHSSDNRVGDSKLLPYYDWYEYKIPVEQSNVYTFEVWGLDPNDSAKNNKTPRIKKVYGDVWIDLYNDDGTFASGTALDGSTKNIKTFKYTELSTFDPEKVMTTEKINVYFRMPVGSDTDRWQNLRILQAHGTGDKDTKDLQQNVEMKELKGGRTPGMDGYGRNTNIWKSAEISKNNPFIEFAVDEVVTNAVTGLSETTTHIYKTRYQGGRAVLFNPLKNYGYGGWEKYQSDSDRLEEVCSSLLNMYYAKTIVNQYNLQGEMVSQSGDSLYYSSYLKGLISSTYSSYFQLAGAASGGDTATYKTAVKPSDIEATDASADKAYRDCEDIGAIINAYNNLYLKMGEAKAYMDKTLGTDYHGNDYHTNASGSSQYPEFVNRGNFRTYNSDDVGALAGKLSNAEKAFMTGKWKNASGVEKSDLEAAQGAIEALDRTIANIRVGVEGTIAVVLYDAQSKAGNGYSFTISYKDSSGQEHINEPVDQVNIEGYPIKFIYNELTDTPYEFITDVQFKNTYTDKQTGITHKDKEIGPSYEKIEKNEVYVLMDYGEVDGEDTSFWRKNDLTDYRQMNSDEYIQEADSEGVELQMKKAEGSTTYETMTVYFKYDTTVKYGSKEYIIKAGAYDFTDEDTLNTASPVAGGVLRLFSDQAETYFTKPENYGVYTSGQSAALLGWVQGGQFSTTNMVTTNGNVNLDAKTGSFTLLPPTRPYSYSSNGGIYFRWSSESDLEVAGGGVELHASEIKFGAVGTIDAAEYGTRFKFYNYSGENSMVVHFLTDITVKYPDTTGLTHTFVIREGKYIIEKDPEAGTNYIADLFNETYWKTGVYAKPISDGTDITTLGNGVSGLDDRLVYGN